MNPVGSEERPPGEDRWNGFPQGRRVAFWYGVAVAVVLLIIVVVQVLRS